jgi:transcription elongation factor GreA
VLKTEQGTKIQFEIVNIQDSDPSKSKISVESPLGKELLGKKSGEIAQMIMPNKKLVKYKILQID